MDLNGTMFELKGKTFGGQDFDITTLKGKPVVVYYWASWNGAAINDVRKISAAINGMKGKVELVCVNLDNASGNAQEFLKKNALPGTQLYSQGGLESALATQYGITVLPNMFLIGADGKVINRSLQANVLGDELDKLFEEKKDK
jgi:hypothetical protein